MNKRVILSENSNLCEFSQLFSSQLEINHVIQEPTEVKRTHVDHLFEMTTDCSIWHWGSTTSKSGKIRRFDDELFWESYNAQCYIFRETYPSHIFKRCLQNCFANFFQKILMWLNLKSNPQKKL